MTNHDRTRARVDRRLAARGTDASARNDCFDEWTHTAMNSATKHRRCATQSNWRLSEPARPRRQTYHRRPERGRINHRARVLEMASELQPRRVRDEFCRHQNGARSSSQTPSTPTKSKPSTHALWHSSHCKAATSNPLRRAQIEAAKRRRRSRCCSTRSMKENATKSTSCSIHNSKAKTTLKSLQCASGETNSANSTSACSTRSRARRCGVRWTRRCAPNRKAQLVLSRGGRTPPTNRRQPHQNRQRTRRCARSQSKRTVRHNAVHVR